MGIWTGEMKRETRLQDPEFTKVLDSLVKLKKIKQFVNIKYNKRKYFIAAEFEPSKELSGGVWYTEEGKLDTDLIHGLKVLCKKLIVRENVATSESLTEFINKSGVVNVKCSKEQITEILRCLVLDNEIVEVKSSEIGVFEKISGGTPSYRCSNKEGDPKVGAMASIPCGACPRINECTPDGIISPMTCVYYTKWLDF
ncbi:hypothetical protein IFM89_027416 [Coptis chinensis]|uniref:DNA-directed RNA polymerase III subunit RPC6 n=1 Tax=Coptis chinensis TaxID=261450 RepID=A0A835IU93_9MAGN|nr:hypothetical protein IFM89_027416 [Coptis chinensis]